MILVRDRVSAQFQKFAKEAVPYQAREGFQWQENKVFIMQNEIDAFLSHEGGYSDGRLTTYAFFIQDKSEKEKADVAYLVMTLILKMEF